LIIHEQLESKCGIKDATSVYSSFIMKMKHRLKHKNDNHNSILKNIIRIRSIRIFILTEA